MESGITPTPIALDRFDAEGWARALEGARGCLDPKREYSRASPNQRVTLLRYR